MDSTGSAARILHLGSDPNDSALLVAELEADGLQCEVLRVPNVPALRSALDRDGIALVVADLPLPWDLGARSLEDLMRTHPKIGVLFRAGSAGNRSVAEVSMPTSRAVRGALHLREAPLQSDAERQQLLERVVRNHEAQLRLARRDFWDFDEAIRDITRTAADVLDVRRVSLWEVDPKTRMLGCALVFDRERGVHAVERELELGPDYLEALDSAMFLACEDAQHDPRTAEFASEYLARLGITSLLDAPVRRDGRIVGVVCHEHIGPPRRWSVVDQCAAASIAGIVSRALEVRDRRRAEDRLREAEKFEVIGRLAGRVAHDFNNLLTIIMGNAELALMRSEPGSPNNVGLQQIAQAGEDASALIKQLLSFSRREVLRPKRIDIVARLASMRGLVERLLGQNVRARFELCSGPVWIALDPTQLQQVLLNLAANARDAMPAGGEFVLTLECIPAASVAGPQVRLRVRDTGEGIDANVLPRIFEPFFTTKSEKAGTGLGLSSVGEIVRQAGGQVSVTSAPGKGACFEILFPEAAPEQIAGAERANPTALGATSSVPGGEVVLLVEPESTVRKVLAQALTRAGLGVLEAVGPVEALETLARGSHFDWLLVDQVQPKMDGARLIEHLRDLRPHIPALLIADFGGCAGQQLEALRCGGPTVTLVKPVAPIDLRDALEALRAARVA